MILFIVLTAILCVYRGMQLWALHPPKEKNTQSPPQTSLIICYRNNGGYLRQNIDHFLSQQHDCFECIVVNDFSEHLQAEKKAWQTIKDGRLRVYHLAEHQKSHKGKKNALSFAIDKAQYEHLVFTDSDCVAPSKEWLNAISAPLNTHQISIGYAPFFKEPSLLNKLIRFDCFLAALDYLTFAKVGMPYMGVGRNMGYLKSTFLKGDGFKKHATLDSGDDDLFIQQHSKESSTEICITKESFVYSKAKASMYEFILQKSRHVSTAPKYKKSDIFLLSTLYFLRLSWWILLLLLTCTSKNTTLICAIVLFRILVSEALCFRLYKRFKEQDLVFTSFILEPILLLFYPLFHLGSLTLKHQRR